MISDFITHVAFKNIKVKMTQLAQSNKYSNFFSESVTMSNYIMSHNNILNSLKKKERDLVFCNCRINNIEYLDLSKTNGQRQFMNSSLGRLVINYSVIY